MTFIWPITDPISGSSLRFDVGDDPELDNLQKQTFAISFGWQTEKHHHHFCKPQLFDMLHLEMLEVYPSFSPGAEASLSRFCSGPGKQTATHDILKEKIGSTLAKLGSGVIQRERSYHGGWEWKIIGTPFRKGFITRRSILCSDSVTKYERDGWETNEREPGESQERAKRDFWSQLESLSQNDADWEL